MTTPIGFGPPQFPATTEIARDLRDIGRSEQTTSSFADHVQEVVDGANHQQQVAQAVSEDFARGGENDLHGTMIQMQEADISLRFVANVRNRVVEAYREIMRMGA